MRHPATVRSNLSVMKKVLVLASVIVACGMIVLAQDANPSVASTNKVDSISQRATKNLSDTITRIEKKITALYEKDVRTPLSAAELEKLDRLQEARMILELRLKTGAGDVERADALLNEYFYKDEEPSEVESTEDAPQKNAIEKEPALAEDNVVPDLSPEASRLWEEFRKQRKLSVDEEAVPTNGDLLEQAKQLFQKNQEENALTNKVAQAGETLESKLGLQSSQLFSYQEAMSASAQRQNDFEKQMKTLQERIQSMIDDDYPDYTAIYDATRSYGELMYDYTIEQVELRRELAALLSPEQMKIWRSESAVKNVAKSSKSEGVSVSDFSPMLSGEDESIVYVPMRLVPSQGKDGKKIYKAEPLILHK